MKFSLTWIKSCKSEMSSPAVRGSKTAGNQFCDVMRTRRQSERTKGVSAAQTYQSVEATRNSCQKLSALPRETAKTYACTEKVRTIRVHAARTSVHSRRRLRNLEGISNIVQPRGNHTPGGCMGDEG